MLCYIFLYDRGKGWIILKEECGGDGLMVAYVVTIKCVNITASYCETTLTEDSQMIHV